MFQALFAFFFPFPTCTFSIYFWHDRLDMNELLIPTVWLFHSRFRQKSVVKVDTLYNYIVKMASECRLFFQMYMQVSLQYSIEFHSLKNGCITRLTCILKF